MRHRLTWAVWILFCAGLAVLAVERIDLGQMARSLRHVSAPWVAAAFVAMALAFLARSESWYVDLREALPGSPVGRAPARRALLIGMATSAVAPARLGEAARSVVVSRHAGEVRDALSIVVGTVLVQTVMNGVALVLLAAVALSGAALHTSRASAFASSAVIPVIVVVLVGALLFALARYGGRHGWLRGRLAHWVGRQARGVGSGFAVLRRRLPALHATSVQLLAWGFQLASCIVLLIAFRLVPGQRLVAAAAVLVAVNITAVVPLTPSNIGVFQAACIAVLAPYGVSAAHGLAYGIVLQLVEIITALLMGGVSALREGMSLRELRVTARSAGADRRREPDRVAPHG